MNEGQPVDGDRRSGARASVWWRIIPLPRNSMATADSSDRQPRKSRNGENPHSFFYIDVKDEKGAVVSWACESRWARRIVTKGSERGDIKIGAR